MANRCRVKMGDKEPTYGEFIGLLLEDGGEVRVVLRLDGHGLFLTTRHPSRVELLPSEPSEVKP